MSWIFFKSMSITNRLLCIFIISTISILVTITVLVYPALRELLNHANFHREHAHYLLTQICIKKFFIGLWISTFVIICASYLLAKKSIRPIKKFTQELASINATSLDKRLQETGHPKELRQLAATCNAMLQRIENAFLHIKQFSVGMAHELRNPIHYLKTTTEITLSKAQSVEGYEQLLHSHLEEYQQLTNLIDNLLFLTRSQHGQITLNRKLICAKQLMHSIKDYYQYIAQDKNIVIQIEGEASIHVDEHLFKRVIANLLDNSLAYTQAGGHIFIKIEITETHVVISLKDTGVGIEKQHLPLLCQAFYRANQRESNVNAGLGLGLAIARAILKMHQGMFSIESQYGIGTIVTLTLPHPN